MVQAADVYTVGLGGDSHVRLNGDVLAIGPQRVVPLCLLASEYPGVLDKLRLQEQEGKGGGAGQLVVAQRWAEHGLSAEKRSLLQSLRAGPRLLTDLAADGPLVRQWVRDLETRQIVLRSAFTPTDALHALGRLDLWDARASRLGAKMLARQSGLTVEVLCDRVIEGVSDRVSQALVTKILSDEGTAPDWEREPAAAGLLGRALRNHHASDLGCEMRLRQPLVAIGAPVEAYMPRTAWQFNTELVIPPHAEVANAVGAVTGSVVQQVRVTIQPLDGNEFRLHMPDGVRDFSALDEAARYAEEQMVARAETLAREAGADHVEVRVERVDKTAPVRGDRLYLGTEMTFTAVGRPSLAA
jgi:N-methylhydantoinase A/oxoprolinase/acetone carboxylase beta subunit